MTTREEKPLVLLVSQSSLLGKSISRLLEHQYELNVIEDAESAWRFLAENRQVSLVLAEQPLMEDQFALIERVRQANDKRLAATPIVLLYGEKDHEEGLHRAFQQGASDFVVMPPTRDELVNRLDLQIRLFRGDADLLSADNEASAAGALKKLAQVSFFNSRVTQELSFSQRHRSNLSICHLKIDNIAKLAEQHGKELVQGFVKGLINLILNSLRTEDLLCYLGHAEFHILYPATNGIGAMTAARRILDRVEHSQISVSGQKLQTTLSGSVYSCVADEHSSLDHIYQHLAEDLKKAIAEGGNRVISSMDGGGTQALSVDRVLKLLEKDQGDEIDQHLVKLLLEVLPLLEYGDAMLDLDLLDTLANLRRRLSQQAQS